PGFLDCAVRPCGLVGRTAPVFPAGRTGDDVAGTDFLLRFALALRPAEARRDDQGCLPAGMRMPRRACAGFEGDARPADRCRARRLEQRIDPHAAGEIFRRPLAGSLRSIALDRAHEWVLVQMECRIGRLACASRFGYRPAVILERHAIGLWTAAYACIERIDRGKLLTGEFEIEKVEVLGNARGPGRFRDGRTTLLQVPAQHDLRRRLAVLM